VRVTPVPNGNPAKEGLGAAPWKRASNASQKIGQWNTGGDGSNR